MSKYGQADYQFIDEMTSDVLTAATSKALPAFEADCLAHWRANGDGELEDQQSFVEACFYACCWQDQMVRDCLSFLDDPHRGECVRVAESYARYALSHSDAFADFEREVHHAWDESES